MIFWCSLGLVNKGVNTLAFNHNLRVIWAFGCDISAIIERTWQLGLCCGSLCVLHRLENIASLRQAHSTEKDRKRRFWIDVGIGIGIPFLQIPLFFIVQPNRFNLYEDVGCSAPLYNSVPALFAYYLFRLVASALCVVFAGTCLRVRSLHCRHPLKTNLP
jgi:pheromone a factor receptor